jgi:hypothetical protein
LMAAKNKASRDCRQDAINFQNWKNAEKQNCNSIEYYLLAGVLSRFFAEKIVL